MKKTIIISAIALSFSVANVNADTSISDYNNYGIESVYEVNSFCTAIAKGDIETVKKLIKLGENLERRSKGMTPIMYAAKYNRVEILKLLIDKGADIKAKSSKGKTALSYAKASNANEAYNIIKKKLKKK
ncbi:ankyrin repeat domain-containing protein [uncultured Lacinutrix sp.]|uniref:ankyrin repeat domain-containing protein n=1 Tax=uncultured Lacinutrix sp. TaxID=574032 RepID=UPI002615A2D3|nr:ankyrin repeat domain-containing protein [uncultured Lacinutrix sp.]